MPHVRSVSIGIWVDVGARDEDDAEAGVCHFIEHMLFKGTRKRSAFDLAAQMDLLGGNFNAFTTMESTCFHGRVLDTHIEGLVDLLSDLFLSSVFDPGEVERERSVILQEAGMMEDAPEDFLHLLTGRAFFGDHPLGRSILGPQENIRRFTSKFLKARQKRWYHPERIVVAAAGNLDHEAFTGLLSSAFRRINPGEPPSPRKKPEDHNHRIRVHHRDLEQVHLGLAAPGIPGTDPRRYAWSVLNVILGGNMSSRLFQEIREKRGLAYSVYSFAPSFFDSGMLGVYAAVHPDCLEETLEVVQTQLSRLKKETLTDEELSGAKEYLKGSVYLSAESTDSQMLRLAQNEVYFGRYIPLAEAAGRIEEVTASQVRDLAEELLQTPSLALALVGPVDESRDFSALLGV
ncbi:MAG: insulinase family protein [Deltaproteobacteria bacterium]|nr:insulinase family protein [Deltaproteobacteria bacterium]